MARVVAVALTSITTAVTMTWPLATRMRGSIPLGTEQEATQPVFAIWQLWWIADRFANGFAGYLDAPIFHPNQDVTTYTEPILLLGLGVAPLWALQLPPALIYNLALLSMLTLNGLFAYRLARTLDATFWPALVAAVLAVNLPYGAKVLGVLPSLGFFGVFWTLDGLVRFARTGTRRSAAWAGAGFAVTFLAWQQNAFFLAPVAAAAGFVALRQLRFRREAVRRLLGAGAITAVVLFAVALPSIRVHSQQGFERPAGVVQLLSAHPRDYLTRPAETPVPVPKADPGDTAGLFPGIVLSALALSGALVGWRRSAWRPWVVVLVVGAATSVLLSFGLNVRLGSWRPFATLRTLPPVAELRSPYRAAAIFQVCLVPLAAIALAAIGRSRRRTAVTVLVALTLLSVWENTGPNRFAAIPATPRTAWTTWLGDQPPGTVVTHVPFPSGFRTSDFESEVRRMFAQIDHRVPMVNGYSGYFPVARGSNGDVIQVYLQFLTTMSRDFPKPRLVCILQQNLGATHVVADKPWVAAHAPELDQLSRYLDAVYDDQDVRIYKITPPAGDCDPALFNANGGFLAGP